MSNHEPIWVVVSDANVLASWVDRTILLALNYSELIALRWSAEIEEELRTSALPGLGKSSEQIDSIIDDLHSAVPEWEAVPSIGSSRLGASPSHML